MIARAAALSVNVNKVALLRNARPINVPDLARAARVALDAGAHGITAHPRPDGRHIIPRDVVLLAEIVAGYRGREFNLEGNPFSLAETRESRPDYPGFLQLVRQAHDAGGIHQVTLVPDSPGQATSDHGWPLDDEQIGQLQTVVSEIHQLGARVSLFVDPVPELMERATATGADRIELYTEPYARRFEQGIALGSLEQYVATAEAANAAGLGVNAGHDLNLDNLPLFASAVPHLCEVSIGHALTADALWMGLPAAVAAYLRVLGHPNR